MFRGAGDVILPMLVSPLKNYISIFLGNFATIRKLQHEQFI